MRRLLTLGLVLMAQTAAAAGIRAYDVRVRVAPAGTAEVDAVLHLDDATGTLRIPAGFTEVTALSLVAGPAGTTVTAEPAGKQTVLRIAFPASTPSPVTVALTFRTGVVLSDVTGAAGAPRLLRHTLLNSQADPIDLYTVRVMLPPDVRAHAVREALPARKPVDTTPRVALAEVDGANGVVLRAVQMAQGDTVSMQVETAPASRSLLWIIAGASLSLLYFVRFRDLVEPSPASDTRIP